MRVTDVSALVTSAPLTVIYKVVEMRCSRAIAKVRTETLIAFAVPICVRIALLLKYALRDQRPKPLPCPGTTYQFTLLPYRSTKCPSVV